MIPSAGPVRRATSSYYVQLPFDFHSSAKASEESTSLTNNLCWPFTMYKVSNPRIGCCDAGLSVISVSLCRVEMQFQGMLLVCAAFLVASTAASYIQVRA